MRIHYPELSFKLIDIKNSLLESSTDLVQAYELWNRLWGATLRELDGTERIYSDDFMRNDHIGVLTYIGEPVACCCYSVRDLTMPFTIDDSFFSAWPRDVLRQYIAENNLRLFAAPSYLAITPKWRKSRCDLPLKEILVAFLAKFLVESGAEAILTTPRADKGMSRLLMDMCGFRPVSDGVIYHNVPVDLVALLRSEALHLEFGNLTDEITRLWDARHTNTTTTTRPTNQTRLAS